MAARRIPAVQPNLVDRVVGYFDPRAQQNRMVARAQVALLSGGGYKGARRDKARNATWLPGGGSPTTDAVSDLPTLRERSRDEMRNSPVAAGALNGSVTGIVGTGLSATPTINHQVLGMTEEAAKAWNVNTRMRFEAWAASEDCDVARDCDFYGLQELAQRSWFESGDVFVLTPRLPRNGRARLTLQLIEGDKVCNPGKQPNSPTLIEGVELAPDTLETLAVHIAKHHPGDFAAGGNTWTRVPTRSSNGRRNVLHLFKPLRPGMKRGIPLLAPVLEPLKQLGDWTDNELNAAVTSSVFSVFAKMDAQAFQQVFDDEGETQELLNQRSQWSGELESGKVINLLPGEELGSVSSTRPNPDFDPFWSAIVRQIGMVLELPYEVLVMHFQSSYSAARGALLMAWRMYKTRRDLLAKKFCQPSYELWLWDEVAEGRISAPGYFASDVVRAAWNRCMWTGDGPGSIDPLKEAQAAKARVDLEISTRDQESILHDGIPWETKHRQLATEAAAQKRDGTGPVAPAPAAAQEPLDDPVRVAPA